MNWRIVGTSLIRGPYITHAQPTYVDVRWDTYDRTRCGLTLTGGGSRFELSAGTTHRIRVSGLTPATSYTYAIDILGTQVWSGSFRTPPASGLIKFVVVGDSGIGLQFGTMQAQIADVISARDPDFVLHTGDVVYPQGYDPETRYDPAYFQPFGPQISKVPWYHVPSAHDVEAGTGNGMLHFHYFDKPGVKILSSGFPEQKSFKFTIANIEFFMIYCPNGYGDYAGLDLVWLDDAIKNSTAQWKIAVLSPPIYSTGATHLSDTTLRAMVEPIYVARGLDMSFEGHQHSYQRTTAVTDGVPGSGPMHVMTGGGGQGLYANGGPAAWTAFQLSDFHITYVEINGANMTGYCIDKNNLQQDTWTLAT